MKASSGILPSGQHRYTKSGRNLHKIFMNIDFQKPCVPLDMPPSQPGPLKLTCIFFLINCQFSAHLRAPKDVSGFCRLISDDEYCTKEIKAYKSVKVIKICKFKQYFLFFLPKVMDIPPLLVLQKPTFKILQLKNKPSNTQFNSISDHTVQRDYQGRRQHCCA